MTRVQGEKIAGMSAFIGGLGQSAIVIAQFQQWLLVQQVRITWDWNVPWNERWLAVSPWFFFFITLLVIHFFVVRRSERSAWLGISGCLLSILAISAMEITMVLISSPDCGPGLLCRFQDPGIFSLPRDIGIVSTLLLSGSLMFYGMMVMRTAFSRVWAMGWLLLGLLALHTLLILVEEAEPLPGFFKVDPLTIILEGIWAIAWLSIGLALWLGWATYRPRLLASHRAARSSSHKR